MDELQYSGVSASFMYDNEHSIGWMSVIRRNFLM